MANKNQRSVKYPDLPDTYVINQIAAEFSASASYAVGEYCNYLGQVYKCTTAHTGAWNAAHFEAVYIAAEVGGVKSATAQNTERIADIDGFVASGEATSNASWNSTTITSLNVKAGDRIKAVFHTSLTTAATYAYIKPYPSGSTYSSGYNASNLGGDITLNYTVTSDEAIQFSFQVGVSEAVTVSVEVYKNNAPVISYPQMIAPVLDSFIATEALSTNALRIINNELYRITAPVAAGGQIIVGTNATKTTIASILYSMMN